MKTKSRNLAVTCLCAAVALSAGAAPKSPLAAKVESDFAGKPGATVWHYAVPAMSEIQRLPDVYPADGVPNGTVNVTVAKDEYEDASFLLWPSRDLGKVELEVGEFRQVEGGRTEVGGQGVVFPKEDIDLRVVKVWYQNKNAWFSYFGDTGFKLCPELLLHDEDMIRVDTKKVANYARLTDEKGRRKGEVWLNPPREMSKRQFTHSWVNVERFEPMRGDFGDAATLQPVALPGNAFKQFILTVHAKKNAKPGLYRGEIKVKKPSSTSTSTSTSDSTLHTIPIAIRVLDFELPQPKCWMTPEKDFLVAFYECVSLGSMMTANGGDVGKAKRDLVNAFRNQVAHNVSVHWLGVMNNETFITFAAMKEAGLRMDVHLSGFHPPNYGEKDHATYAQRVVDELDRRIGNHNSYVGYGDEPGAGWLRQSRPVFERYQKAGLKFIVAGSDAVFNVDGYLYDWHNIAKDPSDGSSARLWNGLQNDCHLAWYAQQHVAAENPAFNRRQNGLVPYLMGYTALCNYENGIGPWNDDSTTYRPMAMAYAAGDGLVDTLQWQGFREGIDDIRYATLLTDLARTAGKSKDLATRYLGGQAMQFLAALTVTSYDPDMVRAEMTDRIVKLLKVVKPSVFKTSVVNDAAAAKAGAAHGEAELQKELKAAKTPLETAEAYKRHFRFEEAGDFLVKAGIPEEATANSWAWVGFYQYLPEKQEQAYFAALKAHTDKGGAFGRAEAFWSLLPKHPEIMKTWYDGVFFANLKPTDTNGWRRAVTGIFNGLGRDRRYMTWREFSASTAMYAKTLPLAKRYGVAVPAACARNVYEAYLSLNNDRLAAEVAKTGLEDPKATAEDRAFFTFAKAFAGFRGDEKAAFALAAKASAELKDVPNANRVNAIVALGAMFHSARREGAVRGLDAYRLSLYKPEPKKRYVVKFSETAISGIADMERVAAEESAYDRAYGGDMEFLTTDVTTGSRGAVGSSKGEKISTPVMKVVADYQGLHILVSVKDAKAKEIELGLVGDYSFEGYIAPGANTPYYCTMIESLSRSMKVFNTSYDTFGFRRVNREDIGTKMRFDRAYRTDSVLCYFFYSWENWMTRIPENGSVWDYENMCWHRAGSSCWNGTKSIHGRSTWGEFEFALTPAQRASILKPLLAKAFAGYKGEKWMGAPTALGRWKDTVLGDPAFYAAEVASLEAELDRLGGLLVPDMDPATVFWLEKHALGRWHDVHFEVDRRRAAWLLERNTLQDAK